MRNKKLKIILSLILAILCIACMSHVSLADDKKDNFSFTQFDDKGNNKLNTATQSIMGTAIQVIRIVGTGVSVIMLSYIGIKYMMAAPSEKAEFKRSATIFVVGAILVIAATNILAIISNFAENLNV